MERVQSLKHRENLIKGMGITDFVNRILYGTPGTVATVPPSLVNHGHNKVNANGIVLNKNQTNQKANTQQNTRTTNNGFRNIKNTSNSHVNTNGNNINTNGTNSANLSNSTTNSNNSGQIRSKYATNQDQSNQNASTTSQYRYQFSSSNYQNENNFGPRGNETNMGSGYQPKYINLNNLNSSTRMNGGNLQNSHNQIIEAKNAKNRYPIELFSKKRHE